MEHPVPRNAIAHEIAKRFTFLRRVTFGELNRCLAPLGSSVPQYQVLIRLAMEGAVSQQELTLDAGLDAAGVSRLVARMAEEKLVSIKVDARDRRRRLVRLTAKGKALAEALAPVVDSMARNVFSGLSEAEEQRLLSLLDKACASVVLTKSPTQRRSRIPAGIPSAALEALARASAGGRGMPRIPDDLAALVPVPPRDPGPVRK